MISRLDWEKIPREPTWEEVAATLGVLHRELPPVPGRPEILIYVPGGQPRTLFETLAAWTGVSLRVCYPALPTPLRLLSRLVPSHAALLEVGTQGDFTAVFRSACENTTADLYLLTPAAATLLIDMVNRRADWRSITETLCSYDMSVIYRLDTNNAASRTDLYDWLWVGCALRDSSLARFARSAGFAL